MRRRTARRAIRAALGSVPLVCRDSTGRRVHLDDIEAEPVAAAWTATGATGLRGRRQPLPTDS